MAKRTIYRDTRTGKFVSPKTYARSRAHGGKSIKRQKINLPPVRVKQGEDIELPAPPRAPLVIDDFDELEQMLENFDYEDIELGGGFDSPGGKKK